MYHTLHECVVGCPILSSMYEQVPIYHSIVFDSTPSYTLCALTSRHRVRCSSGLYQLAKHHLHVTYCTMSISIEHVWACPHLSFDRLGLYTFLHSLYSNFSPSRPLQLWIEAPCETSLARDKYSTQMTQKSVEGATALFACLYSSYWMISVGNKKHGTCLRNGRGCAAWALISYCNHVVVSDTSSNLCIMCCMNVL